MQDKIKNNVIMWLIVGILILPALITLPNQSDVVNSKTVDTSKARETSVDRWKTIPKRAITKHELQSFGDEKLTIKKAKIPEKTQLKIDSISGAYIKLTDGTFIENNKSEVISDVITSTVNINQRLYTIGDVNVFYNPFTSFDTQVYDKLSNGAVVLADKKATTEWGTFYRVTFDGGKIGWVDAKKMTTTNPKLSTVQDLLDEKYNKDNLSIYVKDINGTFAAGVNMSKKMYSASLSKLPILYWVQKQISQGNASLSDQLIYNGLINSWPGAFQPQGTGFLPKTADNKSYTLLDLINRTAKDSDNVASNMIAYYETHQFSSDYQKEIANIAGQSWNPIAREASSEMVGRVLEALYQEGGASFSALIGTDYDSERIPAKLPKSIKIAHKIGTADEFNHDAALVFTTNPYILVIETSKNTDSKVLSDISKDIYEVMK